jgi:hypothetical protein
MIREINLAITWMREREKEREKGERYKDQLKNAGASDIRYFVPDMFSNDLSGSVFL